MPNPKFWYFRKQSFGSKLHQIAKNNKYVPSWIRKKLSIKSLNKWPSTKLAQKNIFFKIKIVRSYGSESQTLQIIPNFGLSLVLAPPVLRMETLCGMLLYLLQLK